MSLLLCDLDDTLIDRTTAFHAWAIGFARSHHQDDGFVRWVMSADGQGHRPRNELFEAIQLRLSLKETARELQSLYQEEMTVHIVPDPEVLNALDQAKQQGWKIAVVTNSSEESFQLDKIQKAAIRPLLDAICISGVEGAWKPDPRLFQIAAEKSGASLDGAWMIGDHPKADIGGANAAGISSIWITRGRAWPDAEYFPSLEAASFPNAIRLLLDR